MKLSTMTTMALLSASCFATPSHTTALDSYTARIALAAARANAAPVAPPAPDVAPALGAAPFDDVSATGEECRDFDDQFGRPP